MTMPTVAQLEAAEYRKYSQHGEDGALLALLAAMPDVPKVAVEFGVGDGTECCTRILKAAGWRCFWFDAAHNGEDIRKVRLTAENINEEFRKAGVPDEIGVLAIDVDGMDYWLWRALRTVAAVVICEFNAHVPAGMAMTIDYAPAFKWLHGCAYFGCSIEGLRRLAHARGMGMVYSDKSGVNAFFVRGAADAAVARKPPRARGMAEGPWREIGADGEPASLVMWG